MALALLREEFGVEELPGRLVCPSGDWWLTTAPDLPQGVRVHALGVRLLRAQARGLKPTSFGLMLLGDRIRKRRVELTREELLALLHGRPLVREGVPPGYVALCLAGEVAGLRPCKGRGATGADPPGPQAGAATALQAELRRGV